tara:strand:- start:469 stop:708 length:240 start_codon:yes stop_codon:yes gene_type:complete
VEVTSINKNSGLCEASLEFRNKNQDPEGLTILTISSSNPRILYEDWLTITLVPKQKRGAYISLGYSTEKRYSFSVRKNY